MYIAQFQKVLLSILLRGGEREGERERERERERKRVRDRETERHRQRDTETERERERVTLALAHLASIIGTFIRVYSGTHEQPYL